jgi:hypothetical protein
VFVTGRRSWVEVAFEAVATVEKLADVLTDVVLDDELATWMVLSEAL